LTQRDIHTLSLPFADAARQSATSSDPYSRDRKDIGPPLKVAGLFAGVGGVELGLHRAGHKSAILCEIEPGAKAVLSAQFPGVPISDDVRNLKELPPGIDLITGGFPCQDLSQAGKAAGILDGRQSSLVSEIFRLVKKHKVPNVLLENVSFMLKLDSGRAMDVLASAFEKLGYKWAYRVVNSLSFGVPQRRERVIFLACLDVDPRQILFCDVAKEPDANPDQIGKKACGFYWTEGIRGLGWAVDAVPTLKGGSTIGIPSPPAIILPDGFVGTPDIRDAERMQGFPEDWTASATAVVRESHRWKLVGNAVTVGIFEWVGNRLRSPSTAGLQVGGWPIRTGKGWERAGWNVGSGRYATTISSFPFEPSRAPLEQWLRHPLKPLSLRAVSGFLARTEKSTLRFPPGFIETLRKHKTQMEVD
jgi:DNA (cytosine-5)-methyltransferase 1